MSSNCKERPTKRSTAKTSEPNFKRKVNEFKFEV